MRPRVVVFAYHTIGVRGIKVLQARGAEILLVATHQDNPTETIWFESVAALCAEQAIPVITPESGRDFALNTALFETVAALRPDFIFSFYYRHMLPPELLQLASYGAFNLHGSLLPKYRGRAPVNWAVLHGEAETGVSLHQMTAKPDAGYLIGQIAVPILPDDTAFDVFGKLHVAAEQCLWQTLPALFAGNAVQRPNDLTQGSYFGARKPADGCIDWSQTAQQVYNLYRAVAPPYPGAFTCIGEHTLILARARLLGLTDQAQALQKKHCQDLPCGLTVVGDDIIGICGDGGLLHIRELHHKGKIFPPAKVTALLATQIA